MQKFDLAVGWIWEYDESFVKLLEHEIHRKYGLQTFRVTEENVNEVLELVRSDSLRFSTYLDRAFDEELIFQELGEAVKLRGGKVMNDYAETSSAIDKATMHLEFMRGGIRVPYTIIISPFSKANEIELTLADMAHLGRPFIIKPANTTGGGIGVVTGAETLLDVLEARQDFADDKYLLQEKIIPRIIKDKRCWYRCYFVYGQVYLVRWDDLTHEYDLITPDEEHFYKLRPLRGIMKRIAAICGLNFFSSEIALRQSTPYEPSQFVVVDYVNDMCDMRSRSEAIDGLPNALRDRIVGRLALSVKKLTTAKANK